MTTNHLTFKRKDGVLGVGYLHDLSTHKVYSVAWPDTEARKYLAEPDEMARMGVAVVDPDAPPECATELTEQEVAAELQSMILKEVWAEDAVLVVHDPLSFGEPVYTLTAATVVASSAESPFLVVYPDGVKTQEPKLIRPQSVDRFNELAAKLGLTLVDRNMTAEHGVTVSPDGVVEPTEGNAIVIDGDGAVVVPTGAVDGVVAPDPPGDTEPKEPAPNTFTEAQAIRDHLNQHGLDVSNKSVVEALKAQGVAVKSSQVTEAKELLRKELGS